MAQQKESSYAVFFRMQLMVGILGFLLLAAFAQLEWALAYLYGMALMMANASWLARRLEKTRNLAVDAGQRSLFAGAALRFIALIAGLLLAQVVGLHLLLVAGGMFVAQVVVFVAAMIGFKKEENKGDGFG
ncbi:MAG: ATP synthase subunit I [Mariprofundus sp.]|nr:ATP synthase subunit I [Mariprofundus sp.]